MSRTTSQKQAAQLDNSAINEALVRMVKHYCRQSFEAYIASGVVDDELPNYEIPVYGFWLSLILVSTGQLHIVLKTHYNVSDMQPIIKHLFGNSTALNVKDIAQGYMQEYSNFFGTKVKNCLIDHGFPAGMSLPLITRGFDNYFFEEHFQAHRPKPGSQELADLYLFEGSWCHRVGSCRFVTSVEIEILSAQTYKRLACFANWQPTDDSESSGKLEFL